MRTVALDGMGVMGGRNGAGAIPFECSIIGVFFTAWGDGWRGCLTVSRYAISIAEQYGGSRCTDLFERLWGQDPKDAG